MRIAIIHKKGSKAANQLVANTNITHYNKNCDLVVNYGLSGARMSIVMAKYPTLVKKPIINKYVGKNKFDVLHDVKKIGIVEVPDSYTMLPKHEKISDFIVKKYNSIGGIGIDWAKSRKPPLMKYLQRFVSERKYELRVHGFLWAPKQDWVVQKRIGDANKIAWNFHQGGRFQTIHHPDNYNLFIKAKEISEKVLKLRGMAFGAVDFVVTNKMILIFLEINSAPGFTEITRDKYINNFNMLSELNKIEIKKLLKR